MKHYLLTAAIAFAATAGQAQHAHQSSLPMETGQSQFAAIAEIVILLRDDPHTDWAQVNIKALRDHLVDMDNVTTRAAVERQVNGLSVTFVVTGDEVVATSIGRMVLAHNPMLQQSSGWAVTAEKRANGAAMTLQVKTSAELEQVLGLGFFGVMTVGAHHQQHHMMIAAGQSPH